MKKIVLLSLCFIAYSSLIMSMQQTKYKELITGKEIKLGQRVLKQHMPFIEDYNVDNFKKGELVAVYLDKKKKNLVYAVTQKVFIYNDKPLILILYGKSANKSALVKPKNIRKLLYQGG